MTVASLLQSIRPFAVYVIVGAVIGVESLGIPLPGEIVLVSAALLSSRHELAVNPVGVGAAAVIGAVSGDSSGWGGASQIISVPATSCSPNGCLTGGGRGRCFSGVSSRC